MIKKKKSEAKGKCKEVKFIFPISTSFGDVHYTNSIALAKKKVQEYTKRGLIGWMQRTQGDESSRYGKYKVGFARKS
jgi:hypothetical protein